MTFISIPQGLFLLLLNLIFIPSFIGQTSNQFPGTLPKFHTDFFVSNQDKNYYMDRKCKYFIFHVNGSWPLKKKKPLQALTHKKQIP